MSNKTIMINTNNMNIMICMKIMNNMTAGRVEPREDKLVERKIFLWRANKQGDFPVPTVPFKPIKCVKHL